MKTFLNTLTEANIEQINSSSGRMYAGQGYKYPSVTTVTGLHTADGIKAWRAKVGEAEANRISLAASNRGSKIHLHCEEYLRGQPISIKNEHRPIFDAMVPHLEKIDNIHCLETRMVSHKLETAGTVDCIAEYGGGELEVIDFKTSNKWKDYEYVHHYFMQTAAYACMYYEATKTPINKIRLIIGVQGGQCQIFEEPMVPWLKAFQDLRQRFKQEKGY